MSELLKLENIGLKGLATDPQPWSLPPEFITFGINFRIFAGAIIAKGGEQLWSTAPVNFNPGHLLHVGATSGDYWLVAGRNAIYAFDGVTWTDVSSTLGYGNLGVDDELLWSSCQMGQIPILSNPQAQPEFWNPQSPSQVMQELLFSPGVTFTDEAISAKIFRSHKNFLFALNTTESGIDFPDTFRWSHPADINGLPPTWDEEDDAFLAGRAALGGDGGQIIDGYSLRDAFCIYSENSIDILDYTNDEFVWRRRELSSTVGLLSTNCVVEIKGRHLFLANGDIVQNDGNKIESIAHNRIRKDLSSRIDVSNYGRAYAVRNDSLKEVWFCVPEAGDDYPTIAYIYNWRDDSWAVKDIDAKQSFANYGSQSISVDDWDSFPDEETWDTQNRSWASARSTPLDDTVVATSSIDGSVTFLDPTGSPDGDFGARIERTDFPLVDVVEVTTITRIYPHIKGEGDMSIQFGSQDHPGSPVRWKPAIIFNPSKDRKIDLRTTGELHAWRLQSIGKTTWSISGMTIEFERAGLR